jgi:hypothetical protein
LDAWGARWLSMLVTLVIRLVPEGLAAGRFVGQVEYVGNGEHQVVRGVSDLVGFAQRAAAELASLENDRTGVTVGNGSTDDTEVVADGGT